MITSERTAADKIMWRLKQCSRSERVSLEQALIDDFASASSMHTVRAFCQDLEAFDLWCRRHGHRTLPAAPEQVANWLRQRAAEGAAPASLARYKAMIAKAHRLFGLGDPTANERCRLVIAIRRRAVGAQQKQARPLRFKGAVKDPLRDTPRGINVRAILSACDDTIVGARNKALLSTAFDTGLRASELVRIEVDDIIDAIDPDVRLLAIRKSKGDPEGAGATAFLSARTVTAIYAWLALSGIDEGPIFRRIVVRRYATRKARPRINPDSLSGRAIWDTKKFAGRAAKVARIEYDVGVKELHPGSISAMFRSMIMSAAKAGAFGDMEMVDSANVARGFSSHSTRIGLNQDLFAAGEDLAGIMDALRWRNPKMPLIYNRNLAAESGAAGRLLSKLK